MNDPAVKYRLDKAIAFLDAIVARQLAEKTAGPSVHWPGRVLRLGDGTCLCEPGARQTSWRLHAVYDRGRGGFSHLEPSDQHGAETINRGAPLAGEIRLLDRGDPRAPASLRFREDSGQAADLIVRAGWSAFPDRCGRRRVRSVRLVARPGPLTAAPATAVRERSRSRRGSDQARAPCRSA